MNPVPYRAERIDSKGLVQLRSSTLRDLAIQQKEKPSMQAEAIPYRPR
jgi:hypothetical protein